MIFPLHDARHCAEVIHDLYEERLQPNIVAASTDTQALVSSRYNGDYALIAFPGTASRQDWITDARIAKQPWAAGKVHAGFRAAFNSVAAAIEKEIRAIGAQHLIITGHSLGGALATLCAHHFRPAVASVITFGSPRVGNWSFAGAYDTALHDQTFRVVNAGDPVPRVPFVFGTYKHVGTETYLRREGGVTMEHPWWTSVVEAGQTLQAASQAGGKFPNLAAFSLNFPHHSIREYREKLDALC